MFIAVTSSVFLFILSDQTPLHFSSKSHSSSFLNSVCIYCGAASQSCSTQAKQRMGNTWAAFSQLQNNWLNFFSEQKGEKKKNLLEHHEGTWQDEASIHIRHFAVLWMRFTLAGLLYLEIYTVCLCTLAVQLANHIHMSFFYSGIDRDWDEPKIPIMNYAWEQHMFTHKHKPTACIYPLRCLLQIPTPAI